MLKSSLPSVIAEALSQIKSFKAYALTQFHVGSLRHCVICFFSYYFVFLSIYGVKTHLNLNNGKKYAENYDTVSLNKSSLVYKQVPSVKSFLY